MKKKYYICVYNSRPTVENKHIKPLSLIYPSDGIDLIGVFFIMIGIYKITSPTKRIYIGQSTDIEKRWCSYRKLNCKGQPRLYNSFKKHGVEKHKFEIICQCSINELNELERFYQDAFCSTNKNGLNCVLTKTDTRRCEFTKESIKNRKKRTVKKIMNSDDSHIKYMIEKIMDCVEFKTPSYIINKKKLSVAEATRKINYYEYMNSYKSFTNMATLRKLYTGGNCYKKSIVNIFRGLELS